MTDENQTDPKPAATTDAVPPAAMQPEGASAFDAAPCPAAAAYDRERLRAQIDILRRAAAERARLEVEIRDEHDKETSAARSEAKQGIEAARKKYDQEIEAARREYAAVVERLDEQAAAEGTKLDQQRAKLSADIGRNAARHEAKLREDDQFDEGQEREVYKEKRRDPARLCDRSEKKLAKDSSEVDEAEARCLKFLAACGVKPPPAAAEPTAGEPSSGAESLPDGPDVLKSLETLRTAIADRTGSLCSLQSVRRAFAAATQAAAVGLPVLAGCAAGAAAFFLLPAAPGGDVASRAIPAAATAGGVLVVGIGAGLWLLARLRRAARAEAVAVKAEIDGELARFRRAAVAAGAFLHKRRDEQIAQVDARYKSDTEARKTRLASRLAEIAAKRDASLTELEAKYRSAVEAIARKRDGGREAAERKYPPRIQALTTSCAEDVAALEQRRDARLSAADGRRDARDNAMVDAWRKARSETAAVYDEANRIDAAAFPGWDELARDDVPLPSVPPPGLRFGSLALAMEKLPGGVSGRSELNAFGPLAWTQPAILPYPANASLLIKTSAEQKEVSSSMMQAMMLRIAAGIPAGQSRFTIIDPLGLGKQFAGFMHLADHDELLVTSRIWTEPQLIDEKLADITDHMEVVIQKFLRNQFQTIGDYNVAAGEVAEPYRFVVVANFPANFTETSARRLASIAASGPRCGVYVIVSVDPKQVMPSGFSISDLEQHATVLLLKDGRFTWNDPEFSKWPLTVEQAPSDEVFTRIIQRVGKAAKAAKRVVVPFDRVAPEEKDWWTQSTATEVVAPLGPAGAQKLQYLRLGRGTSQHALIAGKTGSGKSTLMHAMITSLALQYSPNEIQFYLIDFKKGVEFKLYDHYSLPHARVIAIESEREFGLSVLQQLDAELKRRGDLFRELSVQDVAGFRRTGHADPMPRILLLIDEFQEMFVEDDKLAQDAALILDRLVRQGRAFGMHVLLGSQTLGGSYSLPRATMGQMAIRVALQCNEADSSLILSEDNTAARLLTRPGEAIYNDANGMVDGNNHFQVVFLDDDGREKYLGALRSMADRRSDIPQLPRIVFDGNEAADPAGNRLLQELMADGQVHGKPPVAPLAWLGEAIAIKDPTAAIFRRQAGANMLIIGQREDLGSALLGMSLVTLAAGHDPHPGGALGRPGRFVLFEPAIADEKPDLLLRQLAPHLPHEVELVGRLATAQAVERLASEVRRRLDEQVLDGESVFVILRDLARYRELRKNEGDFGFSFGGGGDKQASPAENFMTVLRDGPAVGIHSIIWCDSLTNLQRTFERNALKEFELRVLFQMSGSDSSQLVDSPLASKLGPQRALFIHEETGTLEKFRPYAFPSAEWLSSVSAALRARPQGTPAPRPVARDDRPADKAGITAGRGSDEFNFTKFLDDDPPAAGPRPSGEAGPVDQSPDA